MADDANEVSRYVVTAHPPGAVLQCARCNFLSPESTNIAVAKADRLEIRQANLPDSQNAEALPVVLRLPINGRITSVLPLRLARMETTVLFLLQERLGYAAISYSPKQSKRGPGDPPTTTSRNSCRTVSPYPVVTHASGSLAGGDGVNNRANESGTLVALEPHSRCIAIHAFEGLLTVIPVDQKYKNVVARHDAEEEGIKSRRKALLGNPFHCRLEEHTVLSLTFLPAKDDAPMLAILYQDSRGAQHVITHVIDLSKKQLHLCGSTSVQSQVQWIKRSAVDGGSSMILPVTVPPAPAAAAAAEDSAPSPTSGVIVVGQRQITYCASSVTKVIPITPALYLSYTAIPDDNAGCPRFLLTDEFGNVHMLMVLVVTGRVVGLQMEALGSCTLASGIVYLDNGLIFVGSSLNDSQLIQIHDEPIKSDENDVLSDSTYLSVLEEYTNLGPIPDFDLVPTGPTLTHDQHVQSQVVTISGFSKSGSLRVVRNGIGMNEYAAVEIPGIQAMWNLRRSWAAKEDSFLVQSFVGETRVLGAIVAEAVMDGDDGMGDDDAKAGGLEEVVLPGLDSQSSSLYVGNVFAGDRLLQVTDSQVRLFSLEGLVLSTWDGPITVASANEAGQVAVVLQGGSVAYLEVTSDEIHLRKEQKMNKEISCIDIRSFTDRESKDSSNSMDVDGPSKSKLIAVGLWDECTVRLLSIENDLQSSVVIDLSSGDDQDDLETEPTSSSRRAKGASMARSLCMTTLEFPSSASSEQLNGGVNMLFVGLGDGILISFVVIFEDGAFTCQSKKEVCLGTQRIDLVPLKSEGGGSCILVTGDRPTVVYIASVGSSFADRINPKLCYSTVNVADDENDEEAMSRPPSKECTVVNVAASFYSSLLFDAGSLGNQHYSLCVANDESLRLGVIDDIQKLHVTTCRLGMSPRRIVHCPDVRMFAIGCVESGIQSYGFGNEEANAMGNCIRFLDDNTFEDEEKVDLEPFEMLLSMAYVSMAPPDNGDLMNFLVIGTAFALPDEDEPCRGRLLLYSCKVDESGQAMKRDIKQISELSIEGGAYSICQFYKGTFLVCVNTKTHMCKLVEEGGILRLQLVGVGHFGHILSLQVKSSAVRKRSTSSPTAKAASAEPYIEDDQDQPEMMAAIVGDLMRSISLIQYYPQHGVLEEIARDFNTNWITATEMISDRVFIGAENFSNLFCLRRNTTDAAEELRGRLDTVGEFHLGQMVNKFMKGSLIMPVSSNSQGASRRTRRRGPASPSAKQIDSPSGKAAKSFRPRVVVGSETVFATVDGGIGMILGLDAATAAFFSTLERAMATVIEHVGGFDHQEHRAFQGERRSHPSYGFVDGDLIESFLDLDRGGMELVVSAMNRDGRWDVEDMDMLDSPEPSDERNPVDLEVDDVLAMVEEILMLH